jgi:hypothetical protein
MANENKIQNVSIDEVVQSINLDFGTNKALANTNDSKYAMLGLHDYLDIDNSSEEVKRKITPLLMGMESSLRTNKGRLEQRDLEALSAYQSTSQNRLYGATVDTVLNAYRKIGIKDDDLEFPYMLENKRNMKYGEFIKELSEKVKPLRDKNSDDLTPEDKDLITTYNAISELDSIAKGYVQANMDSKLTGQKYSHLNEGYTRRSEHASQDQ